MNWLILHNSRYKVLVVQSFLGKSLYSVGFVLLVLKTNICMCSQWQEVYVFFQISKRKYKEQKKNGKKYHNFVTS